MGSRPGTPDIVRTVILDPPTAGLNEILERRRRSGLDRSDEVWEGVLHIVPAPSHAHGKVEWQLASIFGPLAAAAGLEATGQVNLGESEQDFRVPDGALHRPGAGGVWHPTAALVLEIVSPGDETWDTLPFYSAHDVDEVVIVDPQSRTVQWLALELGQYRPTERSQLIALGPAGLVELIDWPAVEPRGQ